MHIMFYVALVYAIAFALIAFQIPSYKKLDPLKSNSHFSLIGVIITFVVVFAVKVALSTTIEGFQTDIACWKAWSDQVFKYGFWGFYEDKSLIQFVPDYSRVFSDYPPGYIYVLYVIGFIKNLFGLQDGNTYLMLIKLPAIIADMLLGIIIYKEASKRINGKIAFILFILFALNPAVFLDSSIWGQMDSILALFLVLTFLKLRDEKYLLAAFLFGVAIMMKPQALLFSPIFIWVFIKNKKWMQFALSLLVGYATILLISIPYSPAWLQTFYSQGFSFSSFMLALFKSFNPMWLVDKVYTTLANYEYATISGYNIYALFGGNWQDHNQRFFFFTYSFWGAVGVIAAFAASAYGFFKIKSKENKIFFSAYILCFIFFIFGSKVHERYLYPSLILIIFTYIYTKNMKFLTLFGMVSIANFFNVCNVLVIRHTKVGDEYFSPIIIIISLLQILLLLYSAYLGYKYLVKEEGIEDVAAVVKKKGKATAVSGWTKFREKFKLPNTDNFSEVKLNKKDYIIVSAVTVLFGVLAFVSLGDTTAPQTFYSPLNAGEHFVVEFEKTESINMLTYYHGLGEVWAEPRPDLELEYSLDGENWDQMQENPSYDSIFRWKNLDFEPFNAKYIRGTETHKYYEMGEMAFWNTEGEMVKIAGVVSEGGGNVSAMFDEQELVKPHQTFMNSTYFDEIYHPRTAYETLRNIRPYENTHPPLGKLIMSFAIWLFGLTPFAWRMMGAMFGVIMLPVFYVFLKKMFGRTRYATIGTLLFAADFMRFALTRMGTIDSYPVFFIIVMYFFMYQFGKKLLCLIENDPENIMKGKNIWSLFSSLAFSGIAWGMGAASKWIAIYAGIGLLILFVLILIAAYIKLPSEIRGRVFTKLTVSTCLWCVLFFVLIPGTIYVLSYIPYNSAIYAESLANSGVKPETLMQTFWNNQMSMFDYHKGVSEPHAYSSAFWQWPIISRPLWAYGVSERNVQQGFASNIVIMGNPFIWWVGIFAAFYSFYMGFRRKSLMVLFIAIGLASQYVPWFFVPRTVFIYHFFASVPFLIMLIVYAIRELEMKNIKYIRYANIYLAVCVLAFVAYYPVLSGMPIPLWFNDGLKAFNSWVWGG